MKKLAAERRLAACFAAILLVTAMLGVISNSVLSSVDRTFDIAVNSTARKLWLAGDINMSVGDMLAAQRGILLYANSPAAEDNTQLFAKRSTQIDRDVAEIKLLAPHDEELKIIAIVEQSNADYLNVVQHVELSESVDPLDVNKVANAYKTIDEITDRLEVVETSRLKEALTETQTKLRLGRIALGVAALIALFLVVITLRSAHSVGVNLRASAKLARASAAFSNLLIDSMPCAVCIFDQAGHLKRWNQNFLGYSFDELREAGVLAKVAPESLEAVKRTLSMTMKEGFGDTEAWLIAKSGKKIPTYLSHGRFQFEGELCILGVAIDISKQKVAEHHGHLQRVALEYASEAIVITDVTGNIEWANPAFSLLTGYGLNEMIGRNPRILKSGMQDRAFYHSLWDTILDGRVWSGELRNRRKDGKVYIEEMHIAPVRAVNGQITNFVAVKHDITLRKQAEAEAAKVRELLLSLNPDLQPANEPLPFHQNHSPAPSVPSPRS